MRPILLLILLGIAFSGVTSCGSDAAPAPETAAPQPAARMDSVQARRGAAGSATDGAPAAPTTAPTTAPRMARIEDPVSGVVLGPKGKPVAGARVRLFQRLRHWPRRDREEVSLVRSGASGQFVFAHTRQRQQEVEVEAEGCATVVQRVPEPGLGALVVRLPRGYFVRGQVSLPNGRPADGCRVFLEPGLSSEMRARETRADRLGRFQFAGVPADDLRLTARHRDYRPATAVNIAVGPEVQVAGGAPGLGRDVRLKLEDAGLVLSGTVTAGDGPLADCRVWVYPRINNGLLFVPLQTTTNSAGRYAVRGLGQGSVMVEVDHPRFASARRPLSLTDSRTDFDFDMQSKLRVHGRCVGVEEIRPMRLELVSFYGETGVAEVDSSGRFEFSGRFSRGVSTIEIQGGAYSFQVSQSRWIRRAIASGGELELRIEPASVVQGEVRDPEGEPVAGVEVSELSELPWWGGNDLGLMAARRQVLAVTDAQGRYVIRGLTPGTVRLAFDSERFAKHRQRVKVPPAPDVGEVGVVQLQEPGIIEGRVTRGEKPVTGALVSTSSGEVRAVTDHEGRYALRGLPPGVHVVRVKFRTLPSRRVAKPIQLQSGQRIPSIDVALPSGRQLSGLVTDADDVPLANVFIDSLVGTSTRSDASGRFKIDVPLGRTVLHLRVVEFDRTFERVVVPRDRDEVTIRLREAPRAGLRAMALTMPKEAPATGVVLRLDVGLERSQIGTRVNASQLFSLLARANRLNEHVVRGRVERWVDLQDGELLIHNLPDGPYTLRLAARGYQPFVKKVQLENGKVLDLGTVKFAPGFRVEGVVVNPRGQPVSGARVVLGREADLNLADGQLVYVTDRRGRFAVEGVGLQSRDIYVAAKGYATTLKTLDLDKDLFRAADNPVLVHLQAGATIKVDLVDMEGEPVSFQKVQLNRGPQRLGEAETDARGIAWFHNLSKGSYALFLFGRQRSTKKITITDTSGGRVHRVRMIHLPRREGKRTR